MADGDKPILGTAEERVKLLRAGFKGKEIEELFLIINDMRIVGPVLYTCS
jgi:hypothetical protein